MTPLRLTDEQLAQVMRTAAPIPLDLRDDYLQRVADQLRGHEFGDGEVYRACRAAAKAVMWNAQRAINEAVAPRPHDAHTVSESMRTPILSLGATSSSIACMIEGTPAITITLPIQKPGAPDTLLRMRSAPLGMRVMRRRASFISAPVVFAHSCRMASACGSRSIGTPNAFATRRR